MVNPHHHTVLLTLVMMMGLSYPVALAIGGGIMLVVSWIIIWVLDLAQPWEGFGFICLFMGALFLIVGTDMVSR